MEGSSASRTITASFANINLFRNYFFFDLIRPIKRKDPLGINMTLF